MNDAQLSALLTELLALPNETEWVELKENVTDPETSFKPQKAKAKCEALINWLLLLTPQVASGAVK